METSYDCVISLQLEANGCPVTGRWELGEVTGSGCWVFSVDDCAADWGVPPQEIEYAKRVCRNYTIACNGMADPREVIRELQTRGEQAEAV
jgi:hypothetical protein